MPDEPTIIQRHEGPLGVYGPYRETVLTGYPDDVRQTLIRMRLLSEEQEELPGVADNIAKAISSDNQFLLRVPKGRPDNAAVAFKRWYEYVPDVDLVHGIGDYFSGIFHAIANGWDTYQKASNPPILQQIKEKYDPTIHLWGERSALALQEVQKRKAERTETHKERNFRLKLARAGRPVTSDYPSGYPYYQRDLNSEIPFHKQPLGGEYMPTDKKTRTQLDGFYQAIVGISDGFKETGRMYVTDPKVMQTLGNDAIDKIKDEFHKMEYKLFPKK